LSSGIPLWSPRGNLKKHQSIVKRLHFTKQPPIMSVNLVRINQGPAKADTVKIQIKRRFAVRHFIYWVALMLCALPLSTVYAVGQINETFKIAASDAAFGDQFGYSVGVSSNFAIVGSHFNDNNEIARSGTAYIFNTDTGNQLRKLTPLDAAANDHFGNSVAISGTTAVIGASGDSDAGPFTGSAYLFNVTTGEQLFKIIGTDTVEEDLFGGAVAISGNTAVIGAGGSLKRNSPGAAYVFNTTTGVQQFKLTALDAEEGDFFGGSVAVSGSMAVIGAGANDDAGDRSGAAYVFDTTTGVQLFKLTALDAAEGDFFGGSVAISGNTAIIGARDNDDDGISSGSAYIFDLTTGNQLLKLTSYDARTGDGFGASVAISENIAIIGANDGNNTGSTYIFDTNTGEQLFKFTASDTSEAGNFGVSVGVDGSTAVVGARFGRDTVTNSGVAFISDMTFALQHVDGDLNGDGFVGIDDLNLILTNWNQNVTPGDFSAGDLSGNGIVNIVDLNIVLNNWNEGTTASAQTIAAVPEPTAGMLLLVAGLASVRRRHR
jgi:FG-GAP repeat protein